VELESLRERKVSGPFRASGFQILVVFMEGPAFILRRSGPPQGMLVE
jgi:hypothetical protein